MFISGHFALSISLSYEVQKGISSFVCIAFVSALYSFRIIECVSQYFQGVFLGLMVSLTNHLWSAYLDSSFTFRESDRNVQ
jgi:hypothetical protein